MDWLERRAEARFSESWRRVQLPEFSGTSDDVTVLFDGLSCLVNPDEADLETATKKYPYWAYSEQEFYDALMDWFFGSEVIKWPPHSVEKGILRRQQICSSCGAVLDKKRTNLQWFRGRVEDAKIPPSEIAVQVPLTACQSCGLTQVFGDPITDGGDLNQVIRETMLEAFSKVNLVP